MKSTARAAIKSLLMTRLGQRIAAVAIHAHAAHGNDALAVAARRYLDCIENNNNSNPKTNGEYAALARLIPSARVIFDVGANVGDWSRTVRSLNTSAAIHCFEPNPAARQELDARPISEPIKINPFALGRAPARLDLFSAEGLSCLGSLYQRRGTPYSFRKEAEVDVVTLDDYCSENWIGRIDFLKLDVEGHEIDVLDGAKTMLAEGRIGIIQFEYGGCNIDSRTFLLDFFDRLTPAGFALHKIMPDGIGPAASYSQKFENFAHQNWIAIHSDHLAARY